MADLGLYLAEMSSGHRVRGPLSGWRGRGMHPVTLELLETEIPSRSRDIPDRIGPLALDRVDEQLQPHPDAGVPGGPGRNGGERTTGQQRVWDFAERVYPTDVPGLPVDGDEPAGFLSFYVARPGRGLWCACRSVCCWALMRLLSSWRSRTMAMPARLRPAARRSVMRWSRRTSLAL